MARREHAGERVRVPGGENIRELLDLERVARVGCTLTAPPQDDGLERAGVHRGARRATQAHTIIFIKLL